MSDIGLFYVPESKFLCINVLFVHQCSNPIIDWLQNQERLIIIDNCDTEICLQSRPSCQLSQPKFGF